MQIYAVREISIRTKKFIVKNKLWRVISEKNKFLIKKFIIILKTNLIKISDNNKKNYVNNFLCSKLNETFKFDKFSTFHKYLNKVFEIKIFSK